MFILSHYVEVHGTVCSFFDRSLHKPNIFDNHHTKIEDNYLNFIQDEHKLDWLNDPETNIKNSEFTQISDLLSEKEIKSLINYLHYYQYGYPDEDYSGVSTIRLNTGEVTEYFESYLRYRTINNSIFKLSHI